MEPMFHIHAERAGIWNNTLSTARNWRKISVLRRGLLFNVEKENRNVGLAARLVFNKDED